MAQGRIEEEKEMGILNKLFGKKDKAPFPESGHGGSSSAVSTATTSSTKVSDSRIWKCPKCNTLLEKSSFGSVFHPGEPLPSNYQGSATCGSCGTAYSWRDVYSGKYDPKEKAATAVGTANAPKLVSVVAYLLGSTTPPADVKIYAEHILIAKYPGSQLHKQYLIGRTDYSMTETEALVQYNDFVRTGDLPGLGTQFDSHIGKGPDGTRVVALYFKP
jgi:hypothetical protein